MRRRTPLRIWLARTWSTLLALNLLLSASAQSERPNVLLVVVDDLNDWVGVLGGHPEAKTPPSVGWRRVGRCSPTRTLRRRSARHRGRPR
jgi:hypothetical protein